MRRKFKIIAVAFLVLLLITLFTYVGIWFLAPARIIDIDLGKDQTSVWAEVRPFGFRKLVSQTGNYQIDDLRDSPDKKHLAYFDFVREEIYKKEWFLKIIDTRTLKVKTVFIGPWQTSFYKWIDNNTVRVYLNGGTGVRIYRDIDINIDEPFIADDHMEPKYWVPEKTF